MDSNLALTLLMVVTVLAGISAQVLAALVKVPSIVFLLLFGLVLGRDGLGWIQPEFLGSGLDVMVALAVGLILFEGGLSLELRDLGRVSASLRNLVTFGTLITLVGGGMAAHWLSEFPWPIAFLYAAIVVVTGPTVTGPLLRQIRVERSISTILEGEGILIDPVGAILAVVVLDLILSGAVHPLTAIGGLVMRLGIGGLIGLVGGWSLGFFLKRAKFLSEDLQTMVVLAGAWGLFGLAQLVRSESGLMAAVVSGLVLRASALPGERLIRRFKGQLTLLAISVLFILLSADLSIASLFALEWGGVFTVLALMWVVRPINVWLCTWNSGFSWQQKAFMSWIAPRGIVSASVASLFGILLTEHHINGGDSIKALVFLTIIITVFIQGLTARPLATLLGVTSTQATGAIIVGANSLSRLIARILQEQGEEVILIDTNEAACQKAREENIPSLFSSAFEDDTLEEAGITATGTFVAMTSNGEVNQVLAQKVLEDFDPPRILLLSPKSPSSIPTVGNITALTKTAISPKISQAFALETSLKLWSDYLDNNEVKLGETYLRGDGAEFQLAHLQALVRSQELLPLLLEREGRMQILASEEEWKPGDRIIYLLHDPMPQLLKRLSGLSRSVLTLERLPAVEEIPSPLGIPS